MSRTTVTAPPTDLLTAHLVSSEDGTPIEYFSTGTGPGLVVVHGTMQSAASQSELAGALSDTFAVHLLNRRGRGRSGAYPALTDYDPAAEVADIEAVVAATGATAVLGISSGGILAAEVGLRHPELTVVLFEPALVADGSLDLDAFLRRFEPEVARGDVPAYMVTALLGTQMGPGFLRFFPRRMLESTTRKMIAKDAGTLPAGGATMAELASAVPYDMRIVAAHADRIEDYRALRGHVVLVGAAKSPAYLKHAVERLHQLLPGAATATIDGVGHSATQNAADGGKPAAVAAALRERLGHLAAR
ncbi:alpha/beta fold hydrolase [Leifsonia sp. TF02-11]|uniref:alpha/beta fold hydrolase n=1 Tax=Leifsonia sp. TF02-11 TaxID=2815212 RepID=UPI001AA14F60|nr:alpha/beta fold hydrolase [Leifsonia sp. TF02-11]MBO1740192.1 alpha/beta fold hydrolase [Leifsonia sp. TF02-11]